MEGKKEKVSNGLEVDIYRIVSRAVEEGVRYGWNRAHKHTDTPSPEEIQNRIEDSVMNALSEVLIWPERH